MLKQRLYDLNGSTGFVLLESDIHSTFAWVLLSSSGALTHPHLDGGGFATAVVGEEGLKIWSYLVFKKAHSSLVEAMEAYNAIVIHANNSEDIQHYADPVYTVLPPGTVL